jgi:hypothetical protein
LVDGVVSAAQTDVGVSEQFLDGDELDTLHQRQGRAGLAWVVEADLPDTCPVEQFSGSRAEAA